LSTPSPHSSVCGTQTLQSAIAVWTHASLVHASVVQSLPSLHSPVLAQR
jgi:hypothetical protein